jgi:hypothetical protein
MNQATEALKLANVEREAKAIVKRRIKEGADPINEILTTGRSFTVTELLTSIRGVGKVKAHQLAKAARVHPTNRVRDLHEIQRRRIAIIVGQMMEAREQGVAHRQRYGKVAA